MRRARLTVIVAAALVGGAGCNMLFPFSAPETDAGGASDASVLEGSVADARRDGPHVTPDALSSDAPKTPDGPTTDGPTTDGPTASDGPLKIDAPVKPDLPLAPDLPVASPDLPLAPDLPLTPDLPLSPDTGGGCVPPTVTKSCNSGWCTIPKGCFTMGSPASEACREPAGYGKETQHEVTLTHAFVIGQTEVTQAQYQARMSENPSGDQSCGQDCPVESVTWHDAAAYCNALSSKGGLGLCYLCATNSSGKVTSCGPASGYGGSKIYGCPGYRLPSEAEWEYAARSGSTTAFHSGPMVAKNCNNALDTNANAIAWYAANSGSVIKQTAKKQPNAWGLYDMSGNVWEWCHDDYQVDLGAGAAVDPVVVNTSGYKAARSGSTAEFLGKIRSALRISDTPATVHNLTGFRCVRSLP